VLDNVRCKILPATEIGKHFAMPMNGLLYSPLLVHTTNPRHTTNKRFSNTLLQVRLPFLSIFVSTTILVQFTAQFQIASMVEVTERLNTNLEARKSDCFDLSTSYHTQQHQVRNFIPTSKFLIWKYVLYPAYLCLLSLLPKILRGEGFRSKKKMGSTSYLDGLRGIAAVIVVNHHALPYWNMALFKYPFFAVLLAGRGMVDIFFVVSGYVLGLKLLKLIRARDTESLLNHFASSTFRRYLRLYLPGVLITFISMLLVRQGWKIGLTTVHRYDTFGEQFWDWLLESFRSANPFIHITGFWTLDDCCPKHKYDEVLWTIPVEVRLALNTRELMY
jgi:hypothetical protein